MIQNYFCMQRADSPFHQAIYSCNLRHSIGWIENQRGAIDQYLCIKTSHQEQDLFFRETKCMMVLKLVHGANSI